MPIDAEQLLSIFSLSRFGINVLDIIIIVVVLYYAYEGRILGFVTSFLDLLSFVLSFVLALKFYSVFAHIFLFFSLPIGFANALGFFILALVVEIILNILFHKLIRFIPTLPKENRLSGILRGADQFLGIIPGIISAFIILSFLLSIVISLPSSPFLKNLITYSKFAVSCNVLKCFHMQSRLLLRGLFLLIIIYAQEECLILYLHQELLKKYLE